MRLFLQIKCYTKCRIIAMFYVCMYIYIYVCVWLLCPVCVIFFKESWQLLSYGQRELDRESVWERERENSKGAMVSFFISCFFFYFLCVNVFSNLLFLFYKHIVSNDNAAFIQTLCIHIHINVKYWGSLVYLLMGYNNLQSIVRSHTNSKVHACIHLSIPFTMYQLYGKKTKSFQEQKGRPKAILYIDMKFLCL